jgi:SAM-dependent methyltransferase
VSFTPDPETVETVADLTKLMLDRINTGSMAGYRETLVDSTWHKFWDYQIFVPLAAQKAFDLELDIGKKKRILDVGCAFGFLCLAAEILGHRAVGLDLPNHILQIANECVPIRLIEHRIKRGEKLPTGADLENLDLITMIGVNLRDADGWWGATHWKSLIDDLRSRLAPNGLIYLEFNRGAETDFLQHVDWGGEFVAHQNTAFVFAASDEVSLKNAH